MPHHIHYKKIKSLVSLSNRLDIVGLYRESNQIDQVIRCLAMSIDDARNLLGVDQHATHDDIRSAHIPLVMKFHPDRNPDDPEAEEKTKMLNHARDLLLGKSQPDAEHPTRQQHSGPSHEPDPNKTEKVTWDDAKANAGIPSDVEWKLVTNAGYGPQLGDTHIRGVVVYGATDNAHVFVGVHHYQERDYWAKSDIDKYTMSLKLLPKEASLAQFGQSVIKGLWKEFNAHGREYHNVSPFSKVSILDSGTPFDKSLFSTQGRFMTFKNAMSIMGESTSGKGSNGKIEIKMERKSDPDQDMFSRRELITLVVNGKAFDLSKESLELIYTKSRIMGVIFPDFYGRSVKTLNRIKKGKAVLEWLASNLANTEPAELVDALKKAREQMK